MKPPTRLSISDLNHYLDCNYAAVWKLHHKLWTPPSAAMRLGTLIHAYAEGRFGPDPGLAPRLEDIDPDVAENYFRVIKSLDAWTPDYEPGPREVGLSARFGTFELVGRLDGVSKDEEGTWSEQYKSLSKGKSPEPVLARTRLSHHEVAYHKLAILNQLELQGTILVTIRNLSQKDIKDGVNPLSVTRLRRTPAEVEVIWHRDLAPPLRALARDVTQVAATPDILESHVPRNWNACIGRYGQRCPLFEACHGSGTVDTSRFEALPDRYADLAKPDAAVAPAPASGGPPCTS